MAPDSSAFCLETINGDVDYKNWGLKEKEGKWGYWTCQPRALQWLNNIRWMVVFMCIFSFVEGFIANGIINVIILALEVRYQLSSKESGLIISGNDFGSFVVLLFIGHFAEGRHKPKIMATGVLFMAVGSFIFGIPHFIGKPYTYEKNTDLTTLAGPDNVCIANGSYRSTMTTDPGSQGTSPVESDSTLFYMLFLLGQIFLGIGSCPFFTIGLTYIDENSKAKMTSFYTSLVMCCAALGVAAGYMTAGHTLAVYVDVDKVDMTSIDITPMDPRWVGAWWIGVLVSFAAFLIIVIPFCAYPKRLPGYNDLKRLRKSEAHGDSNTDITVVKYKGKLKDYPKALLNLLKNPTFVLLCLAGCCEALIIAGTASFGAKILQQFFHVDIVKAGMLMGIITIPGAGGGMLIGGYIVKKLNLKCTGIIKFCAVATFCSLLFAPSFLARCEPSPIAGVTAPYPRVPGEHPRSLDSDCNLGCGCTSLGMEPLCLDGQLTFFSPCHAGCHSKPDSQLNQTWEASFCQCTGGLSRNATDTIHEDTMQTMVGTTEVPRVNHTKPSLMAGSCSEECPMIYVFCVAFLFIMLCTFSTLTPNITAVMRCVQHDERSLAVGLQTLAVRIMGTTPGPVLFGALFDSSCLVWQDNSGSQGTCWVYDLPAMAIKILIWWISIKVVAFLIYCLAIYVYKPPAENKHEESSTPFGNRKAIEDRDIVM